MNENDPIGDKVKSIMQELEKKEIYFDQAHVRNHIYDAFYKLAKEHEQKLRVLGISKTIHQTQIFALKNTTTKFAVAVPREFIRATIEQLNEQTETDGWVLVDALKAGEGLFLDDNLMYQGFHGRDERYVNHDRIKVIYPR